MPSDSSADALSPEALAADKARIASDTASDKADVAAAAADAKPGSKTLAKAADAAGTAADKASDKADRAEAKAAVADGPMPDPGPLPDPIPPPPPLPPVIAAAMTEQIANLREWVTREGELTRTAVERMCEDMLRKVDDKMAAVGAVAVGEDYKQWTRREIELAARQHGPAEREEMNP